VEVAPKKQDGVTALGIGVEKIALEKTSIPKAFVRAVKQTVFITKSIFSTVGDLVGSIFIKGDKGQEIIGQ
jgi:hypothetical protein